MKAAGDGLFVGTPDASFYTPVRVKLLRDFPEDGLKVGAEADMVVMPHGKVYLLLVDTDICFCTNAVVDKDFS